MNNQYLKSGALSLLFGSFFVSAQAQSVSGLGTYLTPSEAKTLYTDSSGKHTSMRPYVSNAEDSTLFKEPVFKDFQKLRSSSWIGRKLFDQHLLQVNGEDYQLYLDFLPDFQIGKDSESGKTTWLNTRGFLLGGKLGKNFSFYTSFYENQGQFSDYITRETNRIGVMSGQGAVRGYGSGKTGFDYSYSAGRISYTPSKFLNFDLGYDKNFIGDGYRSLLLSDVAAPYPYAKLTATVWKLRYMVMWAQMIDRESPQLSYQNGDRKKWSVSHYLNWNISHKVSVGLFESIVWQDADEKGKRGFDMSYLNPILFFRPVEFANGSPDKALVGLTAKYKVLPKTSVYGQFVLNEFTAKEFFAKNGYQHNKWGTQLGFRSFDVFKVENLHIQGEANIVRPYAYTARTPQIDGQPSNGGLPTNNYTHFSQPLAHPWGANFKEFLGIANYSWKRFDVRGQLTYGNYGLDQNGSNYGKDILLAYDTPGVEKYGNYIGQGLNTDLYYADLKVAYLLNPKYNLRFEIGLTQRNERNEVFKNNATIVNFGLRSSFRNLYSDY